MKAIFALFASVILLTSSSLGQEEIVKEIRKAYINYNKKIGDAKEEGLDYWPPRLNITTIQNRPALGPVNISIIYYYDEHTNADQEEIDVLKNWSIIRKVVYTESMPSYTDYREILYDNNGKLLFYFSKLTGYSCGEKRFYFKNNKLVKIKFNQIENEDCLEKSDFPEFTRYSSKLTNDDLIWQKEILKESIQHRNAFDNLYNSTQ